MFPTNNASSGYPRSFMMANSQVWPMEPKAFRKSMYVRYISLFVSRASLRVVIVVRICLVVLGCGLKPYWLKCKSLCCSP